MAVSHSVSIPSLQPCHWTHAPFSIRSDSMWVTVTPNNNKCLTCSICFIEYLSILLLWPQATGAIIISFLYLAKLRTSKLNIHRTQLISGLQGVQTGNCQCQVSGVLEKFETFKVLKTFWTLRVWKHSVFNIFRTQMRNKRI